MRKLPDKVLIKVKRDLIDLHKRCITTYLTQRAIKYRHQKKFFKLYDTEIDEENILNYFHRPIKLFVYALVTDRLSEISNYEKYVRGETQKRRERKHG